MLPTGRPRARYRCSRGRRCTWPWRAARGRRPAAPRPEPASIMMSMASIDICTETRTCTYDCMRMQPPDPSWHSAAVSWISLYMSITSTSARCCLVADLTSEISRQGRLPVPFTPRNQRRTRAHQLSVAQLASPHIMQQPLIPQPPLPRRRPRPGAISSTVPRAPAPGPLAAISWPFEGAAG